MQDKVDTLYSSFFDTSEGRWVASRAGLTHYFILERFWPPSWTCYLYNCRFCKFTFSISKLLSNLQRVNSHLILSCKRPLLLILWFIICLKALSAHYSLHFFQTFSELIVGLWGWRRGRGGGRRKRRTTFRTLQFLSVG